MNPKMNKEPLVYIIILNYNGKDILRSCLRSLEKTKYKNYKVLIVDNGSKDGSVDMLRKEFPNTEVIALPRNLGYARANNIGIVYALRHNVDYVVLLNNDTEILDPLWLYMTIKIMERHKDYGIIGYNLILPSGSPQQYGDLKRPSEVNEVVFAAVTIRRDVFSKVGFLDPNYFLGYAEDVDYCYRVRRCGYKIIYVPQIKIYHIHQATFRKVPEIIYMVSSANNYRHFILNKPIKELLLWIAMAFVGIKNGKIIIRNDIKRLKWITYGAITYTKWHGLRGHIFIIAERIRRSLYAREQKCVS